jgi:hypothetical protein
LDPIAGMELCFTEYVMIASQYGLGHNIFKSLAQCKLKCLDIGQDSVAMSCSACGAIRPLFSRYCQMQKAIKTAQKALTEREH